MRLLRNQDYKSLIQDSVLQQIIEEDDSVLLQAEQAAQSEIKGYLAQRYRLEKIFTNTTLFYPSAIYYGNNLIEYTADAYSSASTYSVDDRVTYNSGIYKAISATTGGTFVVSDWQYINADKSLYYVKLPAQEYNYKQSYLAGDVVWFDDIVYSCAYANTAKVPNSFINYWTSISGFSVTGVYPENTDYWVSGDNRNMWLVTCMIDTVLYHLYSRLNPRLVTELRAVRYDGGNSQQSGGVKKWLRDVANGTVVADLPQILPNTGLTVTWGYMNLRNTNTY